MRKYRGKKKYRGKNLDEEFMAKASVGEFVLCLPSVVEIVVDLSNGPFVRSNSFSKWGE